MYAKAYNFICFIIDTNPFALVGESCSFSPISFIKFSFAVEISDGVCPERTFCLKGELSSPRVLRAFRNTLAWIRDSWTAFSNSEMHWHGHHFQYDWRWWTCKKRRQSDIPVNFTRQQTDFASHSLIFAFQNISGFILDNNASPIQYGTILYLKNKSWTTSDENGFFLLQSTISEGDTLVISRIGFHEKHYIVKKSASIQVILTKNVIGMSPVSVEGKLTQFHGELSKRKLTAMDNYSKHVWDAQNSSTAYPTAWDGDGSNYSAWFQL